LDGVDFGIAQQLPQHISNPENTAKWLIYSGEELIVDPAQMPRAAKALFALPEHRY